MPWDFIVILAVLGIVVPWRGTVRIRQLIALPDLSSRQRLSLYASTAVFQWLIAGIVFWRCLARGYTPAQLGFAIPSLYYAAILAIGITVVLIANQIVSVRYFARLAPEKRGFVAEFSRKLMPRTTREVVAFTGLVITVAICEEFLYRGFVQTVFLDLTGRIVAAVAISSLIFATGHVYQGKRGLFATFVVGVIFGVARAWTLSLTPTMVAHFATDFVAGMASRKWLIPNSPSSLTPDEPELPTGPR